MLPSPTELEPEKKHRFTMTTSDDLNFTEEESQEIINELHNEETMIEWMNYLLHQDDPKEIILTMLLDYGFVEEDIRFGAPEFYEVFFEEEFEGNVERLVNEVNVFTKTPLPISFDFSQVTDFEEEDAKLFKIKPNTPAYQVVGLMCRKYEVPNPRSWCLCTQGGYQLKDDTALAYYGFGSFFDTWELSIQKKVVSETKTDDTPAKQFVCKFYLPPIEQFKGSDYTTRRINPNVPIGQLIDLLCKRYEIEEESFRLAGDPEGKYILSNKLGLGHYGLGKRFLRMEIWVVSELRGREEFIMSPEYSWTHLDQDLDLEQARQIIKKMDKEIIQQKEITKVYEEKQNFVQILLRRLSDDKSDMEGNLAEKLNRLIEFAKLQKSKLEEIYEENSELEDKNQQLNEYIGSLQEKNEQLNEYIGTQQEHMEKQVEEYNIIQEYATNIALEKELLDDVVDKLTDEKIDLEKQLLDMSTQYEYAKIDIEEFESAIERKVEELELWMEKFETCEESLRIQEEKNENLVADIEKLKEEKQELSELVQEKEDAMIFLKTTFKEKVDIIKQRTGEMKNKHQSELESLESQLAEKDEELEEIQNEFIFTTSRAAALEKQLEELLNDVEERLREKDLQAAEERRQLSEKLYQASESTDATIDRLLEEQQDMVARFNEQMSESRKELSKIQAKYNKQVEANEKLQQATSGISVLKEKFKELKDEYVNMRSNFNESEQVREQQENTIATLLNEVQKVNDLSSAKENQLLERIASMEEDTYAPTTQAADNSELKSLNVKIQKLSEKLDSEKGKTKAEREKAKNLSKEIIDLKLKLESAEKEIKNTKQAQQDMNDKIEAMKVTPIVKNMPAPPPPPPPPMMNIPKPPTSDSLGLGNVALKKVDRSEKASTDTGGGLFVNLGAEINNMKGALKKASERELKEIKKDDSNSLVDILTAGLANKFRSVSDYDDIEDLDDFNDDDFYFEEDADDWD